MPPQNFNAMFLKFKNQYVNYNHIVRISKADFASGNVRLDLINSIDGDELELHYETEADPGDVYVVLINLIDGDQLELHYKTEAERDAVIEKIVARTSLFSSFS